MRPRKAVFLGGVAADSSNDKRLARACGHVVGRQGYALVHGGYNGLMEHAAAGAAAEGAEVIAVTLAGKGEWGPFNPHVGRELYASSLGQRLDLFFSTTDIVIAMGGGVGTLHEVACAIWYSSNVRRIPVVLAGSRAAHLLDHLVAERWIYHTSTRPVEFLHVVYDESALEGIVSGLADQRQAELADIRQAVLDCASVSGRYVRADGTELANYFDPFRLSSDPGLLHRLAIVMSDVIGHGADAIAAISLGGVPLGTAIASVLHKPLLIVRPHPKPYGTKAQVDGIPRAGTTAVLIDDVVSSGSAMLSARGALAGTGVRVCEAACVLTRGDIGHARLKGLGISLHALVTQAGANGPNAVVAR